MYKIESSKKFKKIVKKLSKKDPFQLQILEKKANELLINPHIAKPLKNKMSGIRRVHIMKSFVLIFEIDENNKIIKFLDYDHHDNIYE